MPSEGDRIVRGSVIQRSLLPEGLSTVLNVATVPLNELASTAAERIDLPILLSDILGISETSILDAKTYASLSASIADGTSFRRSFRGYPWFDYYEYLRSRRRGVTPIGDGATGQLASDALALMVRPSILGAPPIFPFLDSSDEEDTPDEVVDLAFQCFVAGSTRNKRVSAFLDRINQYDIPSGQSPKAKSDSLLTLIQNSRAVCLAPLAAGGTSGIHHLGQGHFVTALQHTGTGAVMTLILIGTISVADYLVHYMVHRRKPEAPGEPTPGNNPPTPQTPQDPTLNADLVRTKAELVPYLPDVDPSIQNGRGYMATSSRPACDRSWCGAIDGLRSPTSASSRRLYEKCG